MQKLKKYLNTCRSRPAGPEECLAPRSRATFAKRQKEQARQEKQRAKLQRKLDKKEPAKGAEFPERSESPEMLSAPLQPLSSDTVLEISHNRKVTEEQ